MKLEELKKFEKESQHPFSDDKYSYATNGWILIRVDKIDEVEALMPDSIESALKSGRVSFHPESHDNWVEVPELLNPQKCDTCDGSGRTKKCPECDGWAEVNFDNAFHDYTCECQTCEGEGKLPSKSDEDEKCESCKGAGLNIWGGDGVKVEHVSFTQGLLHMIKDLPNVKLGLVDDRLQSQYFKFDGGRGVIMPRAN